MDEDTSGLVPQKGMTIVGSDGEEIGEVDLVETNYVIVKKGLFPQDYYIPVSDIASQDDDGTLRLSIPAQEALDRGLGNPMVGAESDTVSTNDTAAPEDLTLDDVDTLRDRMADTDVVHDVDTSRDDTPDTEIVTDEPEPEPLHAEVGADEAVVDAADTPAPEPLHAEAEVEDEPVRDDMHRTVTLSEEEVTATTRPVERAVVHVEKKIAEEKVTLEVPLVEDEVHVTRRAVDREITADDAAFEERTIEVPLRGQGVEIEKQAHVVEEVEIGKSAHQEIREVTETVRHETARVETDGAEVVEATDAPADEDEPATT